MPRESQTLKRIFSNASKREDGEFKLQRSIKQNLEHREHRRCGKQSIHLNTFREEFRNLARTAVRKVRYFSNRTYSFKRQEERLLGAGEFRGLGDSQKING